MDEDNIITLNDENGNEVEFEFLDLIPYRQNEYVVLLPIGDSDGQVVILQLKEIDDETEEYVGVENEFVLETVFALFKERNKDFFTFGGADKKLDFWAPKGAGNVFKRTTRKSLGIV